MMYYAVLTTLSLSLQLAAGRISLRAVETQSGSLSTTEYAELTCSYGRLWKNEKLYSVSWAVQTMGVNTNFLVYSKDGSKRFPPNNNVHVDPSSVDARRVSIKVSEDFADAELSVCCKVRVLEEMRYGSTRPKMKEKCSVLSVERGARHTSLQTLQDSSYSHVLVQDNLSSGAVIVGDLSGDIIKQFSNPRGLEHGKLEVREEPVEILNILGQFGYSVVAMANTPRNRIMWTLSRKSND